MSITRISLALAVTLSGLMPMTAWASQDRSVDPDGSISFLASTEGVTRISVRGDRIRRIINDSTQFEMVNDESTGDVFLRFNGDSPRRETGFIVTEAGVTIGYELRPADRPVDPVLITIEVPADQPGSAISSGFAPSLEGAGGASDRVTGQMVDVLRAIGQAHVLGEVPRGRDGRVVERIQGDGWRATVRVAAAPETGRLVREQEFYRDGVLAIWVQRPELAAGERTFVVIVEAD